MHEQEAREIVLARLREGGGHPIADEPWAAHQFRSGWLFIPNGPPPRRFIGVGGWVVTDDGQVHVIGSAMPPTWGMAQHLPDDGPNRRSEAVAVALARRFGDEQGGEPAGQDWVGTRFTGGWLFVPRAQFDDRPVRRGEGLGIVVLDNGEIRREHVDGPIWMEAARLAAELEFGPG